MTTRILLAEDIKLVAEAFEALLSVEPEFEVVARVARGDDLVTSATRLFPDVILADIDMPGMTGIEATRMLRDKGYRGRIILLTALPGSGHLHAAMAAGADGYLLKSITAPSLINAIRAVCNGQSAIDPNRGRHAQGTLAPQRPGNRDSAPSRRRFLHRADRLAAVPQQGHRQELPVDGDVEARRRLTHSGGHAGTRGGLAVAGDPLSPPPLSPPTPDARPPRPPG